MSKIYVLSGLGADHRVFQNIDFGKHDVKFIQWIVPEKKETIESYASRIAEQIDVPNPIIIGLSFGGIMAVELAKQIQLKQLILISSAKNRFDIPWFYRFIGKLRFHCLMHVNLMSNANRITYWLFGTESLEEKALLKLILKETNRTYLKWAIHQIVTWKNLEFSDEIFHFHGTNDRLLPKPNSNINETIVGGGHFMILNKSSEIHTILNNIL